MMRFVALALFAIGVAHPVAAAPTPTPVAYTAEYEVFRNQKPLGRGIVTFKPDGRGHWELTSVTEGTKGLAGLAGVEIRERSLVDVRDGTIVSLDYKYRQSAGWKTRERSVHFDTAGKRIVSRDRDREFRFDLVPDVLDRQAVSLALARDVAAGRRDLLTYTVVDRDELGPQTWRVQGEDTVDTPAGKLTAIRVERQRENDTRDRHTTSWLGIEQAYVPVRVLQTEADGDSFEMRLVSLQR